MKFKRNLLILSAVLVGVLIVVAGCLPAPTTPPAVDVPSNGTISIAAAAVTTNDTTPTLTISATDATYMAFSGNGTTWSDWVAYATTYSSFNINTGEGCTSTDGTKIVYVKFKNDVGESTKVYDSIILDTVAPKLSTAAYTDVNSSGTVNSGDKITFTFTDEMDTTTVTSSNVATNLLLSDSKSYGTSPAVSWDSGLKICYVTLGASPTIVVGTTTVNPSASVKDTAGNADASTTVTISGTTTAVTSVSLNKATTSIVAGATETLVATVLPATATNKSVTWSSSAPAVATVANGVVTALTAGTTAITVTTVDGSKTATCAVTVASVKSMAWSATTFTEPAANDGTVTTVVTVMLTNETFVVSGAAMTLATHYTVANVPAGLTVVVTGTSTTTATIALTGNATAHAAGDSITNLGVTFVNAAFTGGSAANVATSSKTDLVVTFIGVKSMAWSATTFTEPAANDGTVTTVVTVMLTNETFVVSGAAMTLATHYTVANVPAGLTVVVTGTSTTTATIALTGNATAHAAVDSITNLGVTFVDAAFTGGSAANVATSSKTDLVVTFIGVKSMAWSATTFTEPAANDGTVTTVVTVTLTNETFVVSGAAMTLATHYTVANVPAGLTVVVTGTSTTTATIALTGNATAHAAGDSITNLGVTFVNAAFTGGSAANVATSSKTDLVVTFI